jgi:hypothetical protein
MKESEQKMVELKEQTAMGVALHKRITPAAGCFGYTQPSRKQIPCDKRDLSIFAALFTKSF